jgi:hypothetical protein
VLLPELLLDPPPQAANAAPMKATNAKTINGRWARRIAAATPNQPSPLLPVITGHLLSHVSCLPVPL